jgi:two-component system response regulator YesN
MKMNWYYRMLLSYAPIFFIIISSLIFVFFTTLSSSSKSKYTETNEAILQQMVQYTDANLQLIERNIVRLLYQDGILHSFFTDSPKTIYDYYIIQRSLLEFSETLPFANSIYVYNPNADEFLTDAKRHSLDTFGDREFFLSAFNDSELAVWTSPRNLLQSEFDRNERVVSLLKYYPYPSDKQGAVVVNVNVKSIMEDLNQLNKNKQGSIVIVDDNNQPFLTAAESFKRKPLFAVSSYTGWQFYSDSIDENDFTLLSLFSNLWILFGLAIIVLAIVWFTIITHINYKPIQTIMGKISPYTIRKGEGLSKKSTSNELKLIEDAIDHLLVKTVDYDHLHNERKLLRQRSLYYDLLMGYRTINDAQWEKEMESFGLPHIYERLGVIVVEIDRYTQFMEKYSTSDQYLLKYIVENTFRELAEQKKIFIWHAWVQPHQIAMVIHLELHSETDILQQIGEEYRSWINNHLELTLSIGIGKVIHSITHIEESYRNASLNVSYKAVFGTDSIIDNLLASTKVDSDKLNWYQPLLETAHFYRMNDSQWVVKLNDIFKEMKQMLLTQAVISNFSNSLLYRLQKEIYALPAEIQRLWRDQYLDSFRKIANTTETVDELHSQLLALMASLAKEIEKGRLSRSNHSIAVQIKAYIDHNYADPNLSLNQVSDMFGVSPKSVSYFFKEELGDKFMDYLLKVRFTHAKRKLLETDEPIQQIAEQVGYTHVISFHRAFKKAFDLPPGEYRILYRS